MVVVRCVRFECQVKHQLPVGVMVLFSLSRCAFFAWSA
jgi:hypothetical protein